MSMKPEFLATGIGSMPFEDVDGAVELSLSRFSQAPFWPQLPRRSPKENMVVQKYRWSVDVCVPSRDNCFSVRTKWADGQTVIDKNRFVSLARMALVKFFRTGRGLTMDRDGGFTL